MKKQRDSTECNCSMKTSFSTEKWASARRFVTEARARFLDQPGKYRSYVRVMYDIHANNIRGKSIPEDVLPRIEEIFRGHDDLICDFKAFLPSSSRAVVITDEDDLDDSNKEFRTFPTVFQAIPLAPIEAMVKEDDEVEEVGPVYSVESVEKQGIHFCHKVQQTLACAEDYFAFLKLFHWYSNEKIIKEQLEKRVVSLIGKHPDLIGEFNLFLNDCENFHKIEQGKAERRFKKQKLDERKKAREWGKQDGDLVKYISPSYQLLPKEHRVPPTTTRRTKHKSGIMNDCCVANPPKTKGHNSERKYNRPSLQDLWEEEKYEIEVLLSWIQSASTCENDLMNNVPLDEIEGQRGIHFKRCVERLYGDRGLEVVDIVLANPIVAVPIVVARLKQKEEELEKFNKEFDKL